MSDYAPATVHVCYFCRPELYPSMPKGKTLCARCGDMIDSAPGDGMNNAMLVCDRCDKEMEV